MTSQIDQIQTKREVKEYKVMYAPSAWDVENEVTEHLSEGWELYGEPFVYKNQLAQSMVKRK